MFLRCSGNSLGPGSRIALKQFLDGPKTRYWVQIQKNSRAMLLTPELRFQIPILAPRYAQILILKENGSRAMILGCFGELFLRPRHSFSGTSPGDFFLKGFLILTCLSN